MDINKWKSLAINKDDHTLLVAIAKTKHRGPGPQFSKIFNDYLKFQAKREGLSLAYIVKEEKVEIRPLKLGEAVGNRFIVLSGIKENDITVIKGNERLRPGQSVSIK